MTTLDYTGTERDMRDALYKIWISLSRIDAAFVVLGGEQNPTFIAVGKLLQAETTYGLPSDNPDYRPVYEHMGAAGLLLLAAALMYDFTQGPFEFHCSFERDLLARRLQASADLVRELQEGPAGELLPSRLPLEG